MSAYNEKQNFDGCSIYTRKITIFEHSDELTDNDIQRMACRAMINIRYRPLILLKEYVISAKRYDDDECDEADIDRPFLTELFNDIKLGLVHTVVAYSLDILSRNFKTLGKIMKFFEEHDVRVILTNQGIDSAQVSGCHIFRYVERLSNSETDKDKERSENE